VTHFKKIAATALVVLTLAVINTFTVTPSESNFDGPDNDYSKIYTITEKDGEGRIDEKPSKRVFWEYPQLHAGQTRTGKLYIKNETGNTLDLSQSSINLPYGNQQALLYITTLKITVATTGGEILYQGSYGDIAGRHIFPDIKPGETLEYSITLSCPFNYEGDPAKGTAAVEWRIKAAAESSNENNQNKTVLILCLSSFVIISGLFIISFIRSRSKQPN